MVAGEAGAELIRPCQWRVADPSISRNLRPSGASLIAVHRSASSFAVSWFFLLVIKSPIQPRNTDTDSLYFEIKSAAPFASRL